MQRDAGMGRGLARAGAQRERHTLPQGQPGEGAGEVEHNPPSGDLDAGPELEQPLAQEADLQGRCRRGGEPRAQRLEQDVGRGGEEDPKRVVMGDVALSVISFPETTLPGGGGVRENRHRVPIGSQPLDLPHGRFQFLAVGPSGGRDLKPSPPSGHPVWFALRGLMRVARALV